MRKAIIAKLKAEEVKEAEKRDKTRWKWRVAKQGAWDEEGDRLERTGAPALPMPVVIRYVGGDEILARFWSSGGGVLTLLFV